MPTRNKHPHTVELQNLKLQFCRYTVTAANKVTGVSIRVTKVFGQVRGRCRSFNNFFLI